MSDQPTAPSRGDQPPAATSGGAPPAIDPREHGAPRDGAPQLLDRRLFMLLLVYESPADLHAGEVITQLGKALTAAGVGAVIYENVSNPRSLGVLTWSEDPAVFVDKVRPVLNEPSFRRLDLDPGYTMFGRTYSSGYEPDLQHWLLRRPVDTVLQDSWSWAIWYPLRRSGEFAQLSPKEQGAILREHGVIGRAYGEADLAHDIRLACHGLDRDDNEFIIGLVGKDLHPLSHVVQSMRKTRQTSEYIVQMGPFFVGRAVWRGMPAP